MGLFDTLLCERPLPDGFSAPEFQTKDLGCGLDTYRLTADGRLLRADGSDTGLHGIIRFCTRSSAAGTQTPAWHEYEAKFTHGRLQHLLPVQEAQYDADGMRLNTSSGPAANPNPP